MSMQGFTGKSYDNTIDLGADTWRHVAFVEQRLPLDATEGGSLVQIAERAGAAVNGGVQTYQEAPGEGLRWLMASDVCKHCTDAACLEVCPTGALFRTEFGTVVVQEDVCNGCGYCVPACPFGVLDKREDDGRVWKCTLCYDRLEDDKEAGLRPSVPDAVDPVRRTLRPARACRAPPRPAPGRRPGEGPALPRRRRRRCRGRGRVLPAARRARGLRPATGSGRHAPSPAGDLRGLGGRRPHPGGRDGAGGVWRSAAMTEIRSYHGQPVIKPPVWTWEIPVYFFTGGVAGASAGLAYLSEVRGNEVLARRAWGAAIAAVAVSPALLVSDLGRPERFLNMLRMFKVTSPMSLGSWSLSASGGDDLARRGARVHRPVPSRSAARPNLPPPSSDSPSARTPRRCSRTPRCRSGTRPAGHFRSCSPRAPR